MKNKSASSRRYADISFHCAIIGFILYFITLPLYSDYIYRAFPQFWVCAYRQLTSKPCPFCGTTRAIENIFAGNFRNVSWEHYTLMLMVFLIFIFEISSLSFILWKPEDNLTRKRLRIATIILTGISVISLFSIFLIKWQH